jgi:hypothetical protein
MGEDEQRPAAVKEGKEHDEMLSSKVDRWLGVVDDDGDLYLDAVKRQTHNKPTTPGHPKEWIKRREEICPERFGINPRTLRMESRRQSGDLQLAVVAGIAPHIIQTLVHGDAK